MTVSAVSPPDDGTSCVCANACARVRACRQVNAELTCAICLSICRSTQTVMECLHRFCQECIEKHLRLGQKECPTCRVKVSSRRALRPDPAFDFLIRSLYPNIDDFEAKRDSLISQVLKFECGSSLPERADKPKKSRHSRTAPKLAKAGRRVKKIQMVRDFTSEGDKADWQEEECQEEYLREESEVEEEEDNSESERSFVASKKRRTASRNAAAGNSGTSKSRSPCDFKPMADSEEEPSLWQRKRPQQPAAQEREDAGPSSEEEGHTCRRKKFRRTNDGDEQEDGEGGCEEKEQKQNPERRHDIPSKDQGQFERFHYTKDIWISFKQHPKMKPPSLIIDIVAGNLPPTVSSRFSFSILVSNIAFGFSTQNYRDTIGNVLRFVDGALSEKDGHFLPSAAEHDWNYFQRATVKPYIEAVSKHKLGFKRWAKDAMDKLFTTTNDEKAQPIMKYVLEFLRCPPNKTLVEAIKWPEGFHKRSGELFPGKTGSPTKARARLDLEVEGDNQTLEALWRIVMYLPDELDKGTYGLVYDDGPRWPADSKCRVGIFNDVFLYISAGFFGLHKELGAPAPLMDMTKILGKIATLPDVFDQITPEFPRPRCCSDECALKPGRLFSPTLMALIFQLIFIAPLPTEAEQSHGCPAAVNVFDTHRARLAELFSTNPAYVRNKLQAWQEKQDGLLRTARAVAKAAAQVMDAAAAGRLSAAGREGREGLTYVLD